ncbi:MAG TPA: zinc dependent phospholipase C family protein, partial [Verrucomicrobiae bacterium]|nr:zinc dependent phospholipase C family protein [Verrucomicrobiae bacterium]
MIFLAVSLLVLLFPGNAHAWGAGIHLQLGADVLENLHTLNPAVAAVLLRCPYDFLYGCIAADITIGKKFTHYLLHCHRWDMGLRVLEKARGDAQKACAYGYLAHLAADTVAHNFYVPYRNMLSFPSLALKHTYWEMRFETFVERDVWELGKKVAAENTADNDALLRRVLSDTLFSFGTNKRIFNSILVVSRLEKWQQVMKTLTGRSRYPLDEEDRRDYLELARGAVFEFLRDLEEAPCFQADPTGEDALEAAENVRRNLRALYKSGAISRREGFDRLLGVREQLRRSIRSRSELLQVLAAEQEATARLRRQYKGPVLI